MSLQFNSRRLYYVMVKVKIEVTHKYLQRRIWKKSPVKLEASILILRLPRGMKSSFSIFYCINNSITISSTEVEDCQD